MKHLLLAALFVVATTLSGAQLQPSGQPVYNGFLPTNYTYFPSTPQSSLDAEFPQALTYGYQTPSFTGGVVNLTGYQFHPPAGQPVITTPAVDAPPFGNVVATLPIPVPPSFTPGFLGAPPAIGPRPETVPEPGSIALAGLGLIVISFGIRRART